MHGLVYTAHLVNASRLLRPARAGPQNSANTNSPYRAADLRFGINLAATKHSNTTGNPLIRHPYQFNPA
jgi:hypothetical protein